ncbi:MAG TPA: PBP1A family penicillin-binding protein [Candidatus Baltobacteraceae bacterium]|jgi:penicillin-binding protein 1A|nr:PBP1A family penicillin-binding protein [Candidatus Baltobacteraceae bacterium]
MRKFLRALAVIIFLLVLFAAGSVAGIVAAYSRNLPDISRMADYQPARSTRIYARDGALLATLYKENRIWVPIDRIPPVVRDAFIANEDHNFYRHHGVDFFGIARAAAANLTHHQIEQGASTITQQLARGLFLTDKQTISRKVQEALLAMEIERYYTKDEILERYLNLIYLGSGAYGVDAAAHTYFGRSVANLTAGQAAMLAGLVAAPSDYSPYVNRDLARERERHVLDRMAESGYLTQEQADNAYEGPLQLTGERPAGLQGFHEPWFTTYAVSQLERAFGKQATYEGGLQVYTSLDRSMEKTGQEAVDWGMNQAKLEGIGASQAALVAIRPATGEILAMIGGTHFSLDNQFNRAWQAHRQPGSSFKVYVYTAAIDSGLPPTTVIDDSPVSYPDGNGGTWSPQDDDHSYMGAISLRVALAQSRNIVAVKLLQEVGIDRVIEYAKRMGITAPLEPNLSLALGTSVISPLDQATGYATLANQGVHIPPSPFRLVKDSLGNSILDNQYPEQTEVVSAGTAYIMTTMMEDVINHGTGYPNAIIDRPAAGKTGTTSDFRDAWFVGFTPDLVTAVWIGNDNYHPMNESYGGNIPARIWARFMKSALKNVAKHDFVFPGDEVKKLAACGGGYGRYEYYLSGTEPLSPCGRPQPPPPNAFGAPLGLSNAASESMPPAPTFSPEPTAPPPPPEASPAQEPADTTVDQPAQSPQAAPSPQAVQTAKPQPR